MKKGLLFLLFFGFILVLAACSGNETSEPNDAGDTEGTTEQPEGDASSDSEANNELDITASNWKFDQSEYRVKAGEEVKITLANSEGYHGLAIDDFDVNIQGDGEATFTPTEPGEYKLYCSVPCGEGHEDMVSTLVVE